MTQDDTRSAVLAHSITRCPCQSRMSMRAVLATDLARCRTLANVDSGGRGVLSLIRALIFYPGLYGVLAYRLSHAAFARTTGRAAGPWQVVYLACLLLQRIVIMVTKVEISARAHIGPGIFVNHSMGAIVGSVVAGANLTVSHNATIGAGGSASAEDEDELVSRLEGGFPVLGDRVWIGIGAVVIGPITLGSDAMVGANSVVRHDVPTRAVASGAPAKVRSLQGSFAFVVYDGMEDDDERAASYRLRAAA